jgi:hypothetical protein
MPELPHRPFDCSCPFERLYHVRVKDSQYDSPWSVEIFRGSVRCVSDNEHGPSRMQRAEFTASALGSAHRGTAISDKRSV